MTVHDDDLPVPADDPVEAPGAETPPPEPAGREKPEPARAGRAGWSRARWYDLTYYLAATLGPLALISSLLRLWAADLSTPFVYHSDALYYLGQIKGWLETGSHYVNSFLGAPGVSEMYDFPSADALNVTLIRAFGLLGADAGTAMNLFYLGGYVLTGLTTAFVARRLGLSRVAGLALVFLYLFIPYHWGRGENHLFLAMFWIIPLQVLVLFWLDSKEPPLVKNPGGGFPLTLRSSRSIGALVISACAGALGVYYMFFGCFFLVFVALRRGFRDRAWRPALAAGVLILVSAAVFLAQMAPTLLYQQRNGKNPQAASRSPFEAEVYGLRITQMLLPIDAHRLGALADKRANYRQLSPFGDTEANLAALGVVGSIGCILCISAFLLGWPRDRETSGPDPRGPPARPVVGLRLLGFLATGALLLATVSGFGAVFASVVTPQIRAYNRISVYIALFALTAAAVLADRLLRRSSSTAQKAVVLVVIAVVVVFGVLDQTQADMAAGIRASAAQWDADADFGRNVQAALPPGAMIFQLPYMDYPGSPPIHQLQDYEELRGYVHTTGFRWSYGAMMGRPDALWQESTAALPPEAMVSRLRDAGFSALWVQLAGYADGGAAVKGEFTALLGEPLLSRADGGGVAVWRL